MYQQALKSGKRWFDALNASVEELQAARVAVAQPLHQRPAPVSLYKSNRCNDSSCVDGGIARSMLTVPAGLAVAERRSTRKGPAQDESSALAKLFRLYYMYRSRRTEVNISWTIHNND